MASGHAVVKSVSSGDTLILVGQAKNGPPPEMQLTLAGLMAPRLGRGDDRSDEPFAWASREFLRKLCIGKAVSFKVEYKVASINRTFGLVTMQGQDLAAAVVEAGWAKVKDASKDGADERFEEYKQLEQSAMAGHKGVFNNSPEALASAVRSPEPEVDPQSFAKEHKGKDLPAVIEYFRDGASFYVTLVNQNRKVLMSLAGVQCPRLNSVRRAPEGEAEGAAQAQPAAEPFAAQARMFSELRLLQRDITVRIMGSDRSGAYLGTVSHPAGNISELLLKDGLARTADWGMAYLPMAQSQQLRAAERSAKEKRLRVWRGYTPPVITGARSFSGTVCEVVSGDTIIVMVDCDGTLTKRRVSLSSVRTPHGGNPRKGVPGEPYSHQAKEYLRKHLISRAVNVSVEYTRAMGPAPAPGAAPPATPADERKFATVTLTVGKGNKAKTLNVAEMLLQEGLGETVRHRQDDERSMHYDSLMAAETRAKAAKKNMHSTAKPSVHRVTELIGNAAKARSFEPFLKREKYVRATVEYVYSGGRVKLYVPKENCSINFALMGVSVPEFARGQQGVAAGAQPYAMEAKDFTYYNCMQRDVEVCVDIVNQGGTAIGEMWIGNGGKRRSVGLELVRRGLARTTDYVSKCFESSAMLAAEQEAQAALLCVWENYEAEVKAAKEAAKPPTEEVVNVRVSDIVDGNTFYVHVLTGEGAGASCPELQQVEAKMAEFGVMVAAGEGSSDVVAGAGNVLAEPRVGMFCAALFDDGSGPKWNRARVEKRVEGGKLGLRFIDYGNTDVQEVNQLRTLDASYLAVPPQALPGSSAFITVPTLDKDHGEDAAMYLSQLVWGKTLSARVHDRNAQSNTLLVTLQDPEVPALSVSECMVAEGLALVDKAGLRVSRALSAEEMKGKLMKQQEAARKGRLNMWQYGDIDDDEEANAAPVRSAWGARR